MYVFAGVVDVEHPGHPGPVLLDLSPDPLSPVGQDRQRVGALDPPPPRRHCGPRHSLVPSAAVAMRA